MTKNNGLQPVADSQLTRLVRGSASQVWHVGRSVYSRAGSGSSRLVGSLLGFGGRLDREAKSRVFEVRTTATETWDRLESAFAHRVARALNSLQIPTARDVHELSSRVEALQKAVVALERRAAQASSPEPRAAARGKPTNRKKPAVRSKKKAAARTRTKTKSGS